MRTTHSTFRLAGTTVHQITFDPTTFTDADLLWLPHHNALAHAAPKRKAEHLAGRLAAAHALQEYGSTAIPAIGSSGEPLWPDGMTGSISHTASRALAVVTPHGLTGIDGEIILADDEAVEIKDGIIGPAEDSLLRHTGLPFAQALTLTFSAKESLFKALFSQVNAMMGFDCARVTALDENTLTLALTRPLAGFSQDDAFTLFWLRDGNTQITLLPPFPAASHKSSSRR
ncbi:enterobactin synthase subunit EntD [Enterobacter ludwigii]|jgi:enterobactin synthetase component D|uniref:enterobactin synthase subunit EntD n=1 Tax=Enterobacter ludwigii TaxID=299767 RepID=UPI00277D4234|nr:enterobactin synthase subunit EntD [Enterobacter ludwigii]MDP9944978.1 enterobactin synthetase component D [Enterobacter ludwigii]